MLGSAVKCAVWDCGLCCLLLPLVLHLPWVNGRQRLTYTRLRHPRHKNQGPFQFQPSLFQGVGGIAIFTECSHILNISLPILPISERCIAQSNKCGNLCKSGISLFLEKNSAQHIASQPCPFKCLPGFWMEFPLRTWMSSSWGCRKGAEESHGQGERLGKTDGLRSPQAVSEPQLQWERRLSNEQPSPLHGCPIRTAQTHVLCECHQVATV